MTNLENVPAEHFQRLWTKESNLLVIIRNNRLFNSTDYLRTKHPVYGVYDRIYNKCGNEGINAAGKYVVCVDEGNIRMFPYCIEKEVIENALNKNSGSRKRNEVQQLKIKVIFIKQGNTCAHKHKNKGIESEKLIAGYVQKETAYNAGNNSGMFSCV